MVPADLSNLAIPSAIRITTILNNHGFDASLRHKLVELVGFHIADPDHPGTTRPMNFFDGSPNLPVGVPEPHGGVGTMQKIGVQIIRVQMPQRRFEGLSHLALEIQFRIIRHAMIMTVDRRELGLDEKGTAGDARVRNHFQSFADQRFRIVPGLICRVDGAKSGSPPLVGPVR